MMKGNLADGIVGAAQKDRVQSVHEVILSCFKKLESLSASINLQRGALSDRFFLEERCLSSDSVADVSGSSLRIDVVALASLTDVISENTERLMQEHGELFVGEESVLESFMQRLHSFNATLDKLSDRLSNLVYSVDHTIEMADNLEAPSPSGIPFEGEVKHLSHSIGRSIDRIESKICTLESLLCLNEAPKQ